MGIVGTTSAKDWKKITRAAFWHPRHWVAQRRFAPSAIAGGVGPLYPCIGVFTVDSRAVGAYGRLADQPLIDSRARDVAVLLEAE